MFSFAALVIHSYVTIVFSSSRGHRVELIPLLTPLVFSVFRTSHDNVNINETSSYVDLAPLYGMNQQKQNEVRVRDGRGLLHPDVFSEDRLLLLPPAVCVLLVLFNRNHNVLPFLVSSMIFGLMSRSPCLVHRQEALGDQRVRNVEGPGLHPSRHAKPCRDHHPAGRRDLPNRQGD